MTAPEYLDPRLTEQRNPRTERIDVASPLEIVDLINAEDASVPGAVRAVRQDVARAIDLAVEAFRRGGRLIYVGAGTSGRLGVLDASECPPTFGTPPDLVVGVIAGGYQALVKSLEGAEDDVNAGAQAIENAGAGSKDFVLGIAASGTTPFVRAALSRAQTAGAVTGLVSGSDPPRRLAETCDVLILPKVGPEALTGSTRMKAGTATKLVLNTVSTGAMIRMGRAYGNLMVDLMAWSDKLRDRGERIVMACGGVDWHAARAGRALRRRHPAAPRGSPNLAQRPGLRRLARSDDLARARPGHAAARRSRGDRRAVGRAGGQRLPRPGRGGGGTRRAARAARRRDAVRASRPRTVTAQHRWDRERHLGAAPGQGRRRPRVRHRAGGSGDRRRHSRARPRHAVRSGRRARPARQAAPQGARTAARRRLLRPTTAQEHRTRAFRARVRRPTGQARAAGGRLGQRRGGDGHGAHR